MTFGGILNSNGFGGVLPAHTRTGNLPIGTDRPLYHADGTPLVDGEVWVDITDPNLPTVRTFYAPNSFDESFDFSFQA